jgi:hypothetical protein
LPDLFGQILNPLFCFFFIHLPVDVTGEEWL